MAEHVFEEHKDCRLEFCNICVGGLGHCVVCGAWECELTTECVGRVLSEHEKYEICCKRLDFRDGKFITKEDNRSNG